ncbi:MAG: heme o synthase [Methylophagaceae bacterium]|jgi:protoheme IX farnesyltransferase|tara:strand:+ start:4846 stop:5763 length:918 start_codon:yes stop_codon:yes gene_type:complete
MMEETIGTINTIARATWKDYLVLCKPKVVVLMLVTVLVGALLAIPGWPDVFKLTIALIGIGACAGSGAAVNHIIDHRLDTKMARTKNRPIAKGRVSPKQGLVFALVLAIGGFSLLWIVINPITAWLSLASLLGYAVVYTMFLKRATPQNITIGGLAGAMPPLLGWTAMTGHVDPNALLLVLIIFAWTPPHFWALAIHKKDEYAEADIPMLPVTHGNHFTRIHIVLYSLLMFAATLMPFISGLSGWLYLMGMLLLNARQFWMVKKIFDETNVQAPMELFKYSIQYLLWLFVLILVDHYAIVSRVVG